PQPTWEELQALGYAVAFYPGAAWTVANIATWDYLHDLRQRGVQALVDFQERTRGHPLGSFRINDLLGFPALREQEQRYLPAERLAKYASPVASTRRSALPSRGMTQGSGVGHFPRPPRVNCGFPQALPPCELAMLRWA